MSEVTNFIIAELDRRGIEYVIERGWVSVSCPFHEHSGRKKKLGFAESNGAMHCLVCGKGGHFNEYAKKMDLKTLDVSDPQLQDFKVLQKEMDKAQNAANRESDQPDFLRPWTNEVWRGLTREFLRQIPSYLWFDEVSKADRILWPIYMHGAFKGCTSARVDPHDDTVLPKTRNLGGMDATHVLFPFDHHLIVASKTIVLVEGQFDALRFLYHGIPALSILGCGAWDRRKLTAITSRKVKRLVLAFDGDLAGERLNDQVMEEAEPMFDDVRAMIFPNPTVEERDRGIKAIDPGNCSHKYVRLVKKLAS